MLGELPSHGPNNGEPNVIRQAMEVVEGFRGQHTEVELGTLYQTLRDTLALVGITPQRTPYVSGWAGGHPQLLHFIDLPDHFYIGFGGSDDDLFLNITRIQFTSTGDSVREDLRIHPHGNYAEFDRDEYDNQGQDIVVNEFGQRGSFRLRTHNHRSLIIAKVEALTDALRETITRDVHQPASIQQEAIALYARLQGILPMRQLKRRKTPKVIDLPRLGPVNVDVCNEELGWKIFISRVIRGQRKWLTVWKNGNAEIEIISPRSEYGHVRAGGDGFDLRNPHFVLMEIRELNQAISS